MCSASTTGLTEVLPSSRSHTSVRSRPCTSTGSPLRTESRTWSASVRQQVTENHDVGPSTQSPLRRRIRGVDPTRRFATLPCVVSRWTTSLPTHPWNVTVASFMRRLLALCGVGLRTTQGCPRGTTSGGPSYAAVENPAARDPGEGTWLAERRGEARAGGLVGLDLGLHRFQHQPVRDVADR